MERRVALLRGINLGPRNRIAMPELREALTEAGYDNVRTYVQSGNVVLDSGEPPDKLERALEKLIARRFELEIPVIVRTGEELREVVAGNPLADVATNPKRYQVSFLAEPLDPGRIEELNAVAAVGERLVASGRELYAWHPDGVARSKLWAKLAGTGLKVKATARNWTTVETLEGMASE
jgi:uncharacterized protein (DUF1697 family)